MEKLAQKITNVIQREKSDLTELQIKTIKFGLECLLGELTKFVIYLLIFSVFSLTKPFLIAFIFFCSIRVIAGGYHENTYWKCFFTSLYIFIAIIAIGIYVPLYWWIRVAMLIVSILLAFIYAPVDHPNKPIISEDRRKRFKIISICMFTSMGIVSFLLPHYAGIAITAIFLEAVSLPVGAYFNGRIKNHESFKRSNFT